MSLSGRPTTNRDIQRTTFVESLYNGLRQQTADAFQDQGRYIALASSYLEDGLDEGECAELLMIDGLSRNSSESYIAMAVNNQIESVDEADMEEFTFQFEDLSGKIWSSHEIGKTIRAASEEDAWNKAEESVYSDEMLEADRIIAVQKIS
jgi:hypothetical protein